jgi:hypothetical protein
VGTSAHVRSGARIKLSLLGQSYRYYLVWLTALPAKSQSATISEIALFR